MITFLAEFTAWIAILFGGAIVFMAVWALAGIGSWRIRNPQQRVAECDGEVRGVVGSNHGKARNAATAK